MLKINKGEPWVMWPNSMVSNFIEFPSNKIMDYDGNYTIIMKFELEQDIISKSSIFAKLPTYCGFDIEEWGGVFILTDTFGNVDFPKFNYKWEKNKLYILEIKKLLDIIQIIINGEVVINHKILNKLGADENSHIIFGCGNYPKNNFNLNYVSYTIHYLQIIKENEIICEHDFKNFIHDKAYDITGNCNFIHKY